MRDAKDDDTRSWLGNEMDEELGRSTEDARILPEPREVPALRRKRIDDHRPCFGEMLCRQAGPPERRGRVRHTGRGPVGLLDGRASAGQGGVIRRIARRAPARPAPSDGEATRWCFRRSVPHRPATGDVHTAWAGELRTGPDGPVVATEFVATSISPGGDGSETRPGVEERLRRNPDLRFFNNRRGDGLHEASPARLEATCRALPYVTRPGAPREDRGRFVVEAGRSGMVAG